MMKKIMSIMVAALAMLTACNEDKIQTFESEEAGIYFQDGYQTRFFLNIDAYNDSTGISFSQADDNVTDTILSARLRTLGKVRDYDRKVRVVVDAEHSTAIEGKHYEANFDTVTIKAGKSEAYVSVRFLRTPDLKEQQVRLVVKVEDNENFTVPFSTQKNTNVYYASGDTIRADAYIFEVNEFYKEPELWTMFGNEPMGPWSISKQRLMTKLFDLTAYDWSIDGWANGDGKVLYKTFYYFAVKMRIYLQAEADAGRPVIDDDGSYMQLGENYQVDYSAYFDK